MIIPSIDVQDGQTVQLIGGAELELEAGAPRPLAERFMMAGDLAIVDLDAAMGKGSNRALIEDLLHLVPCRVGGGIRSASAALEWLDAGARAVVLGTAARPDVLSKLPPERTIAALDAVDGEVVVEGWKTKTGASIVDRMRELEGLVGGFLVTFVEREGRMEGTNMERVAELVDAAGGARLTIAGGVTTAREVAQLDALGADAQVGMALYKGAMNFAEAIVSPMLHTRNLDQWTTVVTDIHGVALAVGVSDFPTLAAAVDAQQARWGLHSEGEPKTWPGRLERVTMSEDRSSVRLMVREDAAHTQPTVWGRRGGFDELARTIARRFLEAPEGSYTRRLFDDPDLLRAKLFEEARELTEASTPDEVAWETADVVYFALVQMTRGGARLEDVEAHLDRRALRVRRRPGNAK